jgi:hypothetical protein
MLLSSMMQHRASRKYKLHKDPISGRTGLTVANIPTSAPAGRKLRQQVQPVPSGTEVMPGMDVCLPAADAAKFMVGTHATQLTVSNAVYKAGGCDLSTCAKDAQSGLYSCSTGLQWGVVQSWPQDHAMAAMFGNSGAPHNVTTAMMYWFTGLRCYSSKY